VIRSRYMRWVALLMLASGCGPIEYISMVTFQASKAVQEAKATRASELAPYEYTAAVEYLHKARDVGGYARYHEAIEWGKKARDFGYDAVKLARERSDKPIVGTKGVEEKHE
jgi:hypothetical protein